MGEKRSIGTTIFAVLFIMIGLHGAFKLGQYILLSSKYAGFSTDIIILDIKIWGGMLIQASFLIAGIGIFKLRAWARKLVLLLSTVVIVYHIATIPDTLRAYRTIVPFLVELLEMEARLETVKLVAITQFIIYICTIGLFSCGLFYFTRPKVKEQFK